MDLYCVGILVVNSPPGEELDASCDVFAIEAASIYEANGKADRIVERLFAGKRVLTSVRRAADVLVKDAEKVSFKTEAPHA